MTTKCFPMCHWFVLQEKRQFVPWMTTIPNFEAFFGMAIEVKFLIPFAWHIALLALPKKKGEIVVKNGATFSLTVVFVVFCLGWVLVKISWRWNSSVWWSNELRFLMDGVMGFVVTYSYLGWSWLSPGKRFVYILLEQSWKTLKLQQSLLHLLFEGCTVNTCIYLFVLKYTWILQNVYIYLNKQMWHDMTHMTDHLVSAYQRGDEVYSVSVWLGLYYAVLVKFLAVPYWGHHVVKCWRIRGLTPGATNSQVRGDCGAICGFCVECPAKRISVTRRIWGEDGLTFILSTGWKS